VGGGPSQIQKDAAVSQKELTKEETAVARARNAREEDQYQQVKPYAFNRLNNGLPFFNVLTDNVGGVIRRSFQPAHASLARRVAGSGVPSGSYDAQVRALDADEARAQSDATIQALLANENAKSEAARLITGQQQIANPAQFYGLANSGNNSIMQAPLQSPGVGGILGGVTGAAVGNGGILTKIPF
jgi:hypothetical protein